MSNQYYLKYRCTCLLFYSSGGEEISISTTYASKRDAATSQKAYADTPNFVQIFTLIHQPLHSWLQDFTNRFLRYNTK